MATTKNTASFFKSIVLYGLILGALLIVLKLLEFNLVIKNNVFEVYAGIIAILFCAVGIWVGLKLTNKNKKIVVEVQGTSDWKLDESMLKELSISKREYDVLELIAQGHTNQEVADKLFVSPNTIKTHLANLFAKLDVNRRTQAIQRAKLLTDFPSLDLNILKVGVFGKTCALTQVINDGDRVEIYLPTREQEVQNAEG